MCEDSIPNIIASWKVYTLTHGLMLNSTATIEDAPAKDNNQFYWRRYFNMIKRLQSTDCYHILQLVSIASLLRLNL
jgi:hypothetical protein